MTRCRFATAWLVGEDEGTPAPLPWSFHVAAVCPPVFVVFAEGLDGAVRERHAVRVETARIARLRGLARTHHDVARRAFPRDGGERPHGRRGQLHHRIPARASCR